MRLAAIFLCAAGPVWADDVALLGYMGGQGCTFGVHSMAGAVAAGFDAVEIDLFITQALERGDASQQGLWVVLEDSVCTIRLPNIHSQLPMDSPEIRTAAPYITETYEINGETRISEGCFLVDGLDLFTARNEGDVDAENSEFLNFLGAGIISGALRFYGPTPLETPLGFQVTTGDCAKAPNIADITQNYPFIEAGFGAYVRFVGANTICGEDVTHIALPFVANLQGYDTAADPSSPQPVINAWLNFEYDIITQAAGWYDGMLGTQRGTPRPPLCHYPAQ